MEKTIFEQMGGTYTLQGDYYLPNLALPAEENKPIGIWGQRHKRYPGTASGEPEHQSNCQTRQCDGDCL